MATIYLPKLQTINISDGNHRLGAYKGLKKTKVDGKITKDELVKAESAAWSAARRR
jgi:hypothetical protein